MTVIVMVVVVKCNDVGNDSDDEIMVVMMMKAM